MAKVESSSISPMMMAYEVAFIKGRRWQILTLLLAIMLILEAGVLLYLLPLKDTEIRYVEFTHARDNFFTIYPANMTKSERSLLTRKVLRHYVVSRHVIDNLTEKYRFAEVVAMSSPTIITALKEEYKKQKAQLKGVVREVEILYDLPIDQGVHQVAFKTLDRKAGLERTQEWVVHIQYRKVDKTITEEVALKNPLMIEVTKYVLSKHHSAEVTDAL